MYNYEMLIDSAEKNAVKSSGLSAVLFETKLQSAYATILANAPEGDREATEAELRLRGFDPDFVGYQAGPGECSDTGIDENCCPCGWHT